MVGELEMCRPCRPNRNSCRCRTRQIAREWIRYQTMSESASRVPLAGGGILEVASQDHSQAASVGSATAATAHPLPPAIAAFLDDHKLPARLFTHPPVLPRFVRSVPG